MVSKATEMFSNATQNTRKVAIGLAHFLFQRLSAQPDLPKLFDFMYLYIHIPVFWRSFFALVVSVALGALAKLCHWYQYNLALTTLINFRVRILKTRSCIRMGFTERVDLFLNWEFSAPHRRLPPQIRTGIIIRTRNKCRK